MQVPGFLVQSSHVHAFLLMFLKSVFQASHTKHAEIVSLVILQKWHSAIAHFASFAQKGVCVGGGGSACWPTPLAALI